MTLRIILLSASGSAALLLSGCGSNTTEDPIATSTNAGDGMSDMNMSPAPSEAAGSVLPMTGQAFVDSVTASDEFEMESARIVQSSGASGPSRDFARMMLKDHEASSRDLGTAITASQNVKMQDDPIMTVEQQTMLTELRAAPKDAIAEVYARQQVAAHQQTLTILETYAQSGDAQPLMDFANKTAGVVGKHLEEARKLP